MLWFGISVHMFFCCLFPFTMSLVDYFSLLVVLWFISFQDFCCGLFQFTGCFEVYFLSQFLLWIISIHSGNVLWFISFYDFCCGLFQFTCCFVVYLHSQFLLWFISVHNFLSCLKVFSDLRLICGFPWVHYYLHQFLACHKIMINVIFVGFCFYSRCGWNIQTY